MDVRHLAPILTVAVFCRDLDNTALGSARVLSIYQQIFRPIGHIPETNNRDKRT